MPDEPVQTEVRNVLSQYGRFVQHARYGEVWVPTVTPQDWHPYPPCNWVKTQQYGWYYDDKTPWGQIVHHYGRWFYDQQIGWAWDPGSEFSPGWVVWRSSPGMDGLGADAAGPVVPERSLRCVQQQRSVDLRRDREVQRWLRADADRSGRTRAGAAAPDQMGHRGRVRRRHRRHRAAALRGRTDRQYQHRIRSMGALVHGPGDDGFQLRLAEGAEFNVAHVCTLSNPN